MRNSSSVIGRHERAFVLVAEKLGWLNWVDDRVVQSALGSVPSREQTLAPRVLRLIEREHEAPAKPEEGRDKGDKELEDEWAGFLAEIMLQFSESELSHTQPGPTFADNPAGFVEWVRDELNWIEKQKEVGIDSRLATELGRSTRIWIAHGFVGRQSKASRRYLSELVELWDIAYSIEASTQD